MRDSLCEAHYNQTDHGRLSNSLLFSQQAFFSGFYSVIQLNCQSYFMRQDPDLFIYLFIYYVTHLLCDDAYVNTLNPLMAPVLVASAGNKLDDGDISLAKAMTFYPPL